jgi:UDP-N-acetylmuramate: L-alanyl-gamma-D-glutamyl-meso-diaminopimelate ligase
MRMHIIGVGTTFMTGLAMLARRAGHYVSGSDTCFDLPTRTKLTEANVILKEGFSSENVADKLDLVVIGNELSPTNVELLEARRRMVPYVSGAFWLQEYILNDKWSNYVAPSPQIEEPVKKSNVPKINEKPPAKRAPKIPPERGTKVNHRIIQ